jgi:hypothetical protein
MKTGRSVRAVKRFQTSKLRHTASVRTAPERTAPARRPRADVRITRTAEVNEPDLTEKACRKTTLGLAVTSNIPPCRIAVMGNKRRRQG